jgi:two-component system, sensor histidine kinase and response regulator
MHPPPRKSRILVVDDVVKNLQVVGSVLRNQGYEIMPAPGGVDALRMVKAQLPDLILLDLMMPEIDGLEVCRRLKADTATAGIPVVFLTASNEMEHLVRGFEAGAVDYVTKPFNPPELLARVRTHLELKLARERLREMNDEKNEFMGMAAHDLRNPLSAIRGYAEMVVEDAEASNHAAIAENGLLIRDAAIRMAEMVQSLLDANRIERGDLTINLMPADLAAVASAVVRSHRPRAAAKKQTIHIAAESEPALGLMDPAVMTQVLDNLVSNAVKYSPPGLEIFVATRIAGASVRAEVRDQGPGLNEADRRKLFGKFARLSAKPTGGEQATGLGLSIVKRMVDAMNGRIGCDSEPGRGAVFWVELPAGQ